MFRASFITPSRFGILLTILSLIAGCGGSDGDGGPMAPELPQVAGTWQITANPQPGTTCPGVAGDTFQGIITQSGSQIFLRTTVEGVSGELVYDGSVQTSGSFTLQQSHVITFGDGSQGTTTSTVNGSFSGNSLSATENETLAIVGTNVSCVIVWRWIGNRGSGSTDVGPARQLRSSPVGPHADWLQW
jgi:hypothetical protein